MNIRPACAADCVFLAQIDQQSNPAAWSEQQFQASLNTPHNHIYLIEIEQKIVAFAIWQTLCQESELHLIATDEDHRQQGFASELLHFWLQHSTKADCMRWFLEVRQSNAAAQNLYRKFGFAATGERKNYYRCADGSSENAVLMEKSC
ncbi:MAG: ribosomal protein S18-alanine N-acetyltransferase [Neisseria sp.]|nr:ribosomal protein S18-alanine N-acetyltransferase [Neisseria sp.]